MRAVDSDPPYLRGIDRLDLGLGPVSVDISNLPGNDHREAFAVIFDKVLSDNRNLLSSFHLAGVVGARAAMPLSLRHLPMPMAAVAQSGRELALALYDSLNEEVALELSGDRTSSRLIIRFDNPWFELVR